MSKHSNVIEERAEVAAMRERLDTLSDVRDLERMPSQHKIRANDSGVSTLRSSAYAGAFVALVLCGFVNYRRILSFLSSLTVRKTI